MRVLFAVTHLGFLRNFESSLALLAERGHEVRVVSDRRPAPGVNDATPIVDRLVTHFPAAFTWETIRAQNDDRWYALATTVREALNYWRYLSPAFADAPKLRARARKQAPAPLVWLSELPVLRSRGGLRVLSALFRGLERAIPVQREIEMLFDRWPPDLLFVTPLLYFGSRQVDYVRCARRRGIGSVLGVGSWDHLTTKGLIHEVPDRILVWNELQRTEAAELHGVRPEQVVVTGAQAYDHWFATRPSLDRDVFCSRVGLLSERPYLLYLCSSPFIAPYEVDVVRRWIGAIRASRDARLRTAGVLVRPHPQNAAQWTEVDLSAEANVAIWPRAGANPTGLDARHEYYDSMYHAHAVVGVNTSALIESGIVGRLVYSFLVPEFAGTQEGTLHFQHLKRGGLLALADTLEDHVERLERSFGSTEADRERVRGFIQSFVRPHGLDESATPRVVHAIEEQAALGPAPRGLPLRVRTLQLALRVLVSVAAVPRAAARLAEPAERARLGQMVRRRARSTRKLARRVLRKA